MGARERLWELYQTPEGALDFDEALDAYAHELAEKIRNADGPAATGLLVGGFWWDERDRDHAADLIDPEVAR